MNKLCSVFWDVDGTLADTEMDGHRVAFNAALPRRNLLGFGIATSTLNFYEYQVGDNVLRTMLGAWEKSSMKSFWLSCVDVNNTTTSKEYVLDTSLGDRVCGVFSRNSN